MRPLQIISIAEQVASHLRSEIERGTLAGEMPGAKKLAYTLGVNHKTIDAAAALLEKQGLLQPQGAGKPRLITPPKDSKSKSLRVAILIYEPDDASHHLIIELRHMLADAGHSCVVADKSQMELRWDVKRIAQLVKKTKADAWVVQSSTPEILGWFQKEDIPFIALHGRFMQMNIAAAGTSISEGITEAVDHLVGLGHRRIVILAQETDITPTPGGPYVTFLKRLEHHGIQTSSYNLPRWECSTKGLHQSLDSLFKLTPPTAMFVTDVALFFPTYLHLLDRGIKVPEQLSLICTDQHPQFNWCEPSIAHFHWDPMKLIMRIIKWANNTANSKEDLDQALYNMEFVNGNSIGPPPGGSDTH